MAATEHNQTLVLATGNRGKLREMAALLAGQPFSLSCLADHGIGEVDETGLTFLENALIKARNAARLTGRPAIADDSGLVVAALRGQPGIHSARYAGKGAEDGENTQKLLKAMACFPMEQRQAQFYCAMVYLAHVEDPAPLIGIGEWHGLISQAPAGENGFGYDPVFFVPAQQCTAAQLAGAEKNRLSHRSQAMRMLLQRLTAGEGQG